MPVRKRAARTPTGAPRFFADAARFRAWLAKHHARKGELVVGFHKVATGRPSMTWAQSVDAALAFGWIDGVRRSLGPDAYSIRFTPRRAGSVWSLVNVRRVAALRQAGLMAPAGERAFAARRAERTGVYSFERVDGARKAAALPAAMEATLRRSAAASKDWSARPPWYRRAAASWVVSAKKDETRARRLAILVEASAAGRAIPPLDRANRR